MSRSLPPEVPAQQPGPGGLADVSPSRHRYLAVRDWLPSYRRSWLPLDVVAGLTVWALVVPEALAYAGIAGVPVQFGLYAVPLALLAYAVLGGSRELVMGPSATVASLSAVAVGSVAAAGSSVETYVSLTAALALMVGVIYVAAGLLRLGFIANFFAKPVLDGFIIGLGLFIVVGQLPKLVGIPKPSGDTVVVLVDTLRDIGSWQWDTAAVGAVALALLFGMKRFTPRVPAAIVVVALSLVAVPVLDLAGHGVATVGNVPTGFQMVEWQGVTWESLGDLLPGALAIVVVGFAQSIAIAKSYAAERHYEVDASSEMVAYGATNLGAGALQGFTITGSLSKTAAAQEARAKSQVAAVVAAAMVVLTILVLAGLFEDLPETVLAAIVIEAVSGMIKFPKLVRLRAVRTPELWAALAALLGVVLVGILAGVVIGVAASFALLVHSLDAPHIATLGLSPDRQRAGDVDLDDALATVPGVLVQRFEAPLVFSNAAVFTTEMTARVRDAKPPPRALVIDLGPIAEVDVTGAEAVGQLGSTLAAMGVRLVLARANGSVRETFHRLGVLDQLDGDTLQPSVREAVRLVTPRVP